MAGFRVFMKPGGWRVTDGVCEHGPYPTYEQAVRSADNLNLQTFPAEERSFAPSRAADLTPKVWRARKEQPAAELSDEERAAQAAIERARVQSTDSPAEASASLGGGVV